MAIKEMKETEMLGELKSGDNERLEIRVLYIMNQSLLIKWMWQWLMRNK
jgi:hypothetical protein